MRPAAALLAQAAIFFAFVHGAAPAAVEFSSWLVLYALLAALLCLVSLHAKTDLAASSWAAVLIYSILLSAFFFGADLALTVLGNSVKQRATLPTFLSGLSLHFVLFPGVASVAAGALAGIGAQSLQQAWRQAKSARSGRAPSEA